MKHVEDKTLNSDEKAEVDHGRRKALAKLGLFAVVTYSAPLLLAVSEARAKGGSGGGRGGSGSGRGGSGDNDGRGDSSGASGGPVRQVQAVQPAPPAQVVMTKNQVEDAVEDVAEDVAEVGVVVGAHQARRKVPVFRMVLKAVSEYTDRLCNLTGRLAVKGKPLKC
jgi:hypothetical protein